VHGKIFAFILLVLLISLPIAVWVPTVKADVYKSNCIMYGSGVTLYSPLNKTYATGDLPLNLTFGKGMGLECHLSYSIDGQSYGEFPLAVIPNQGQHVVTYTTGLVQMPTFKDGLHSVTLQVDASGGNYAHSWTHTVNFIVDTGSPIATPHPTATSTPGEITEDNASQTIASPTPISDSPQPFPITVAIILTAIAFCAAAVFAWAIKKSGR
jgi:hypothetical protein